MNINYPMPKSEPNCLAPTIRRGARVVFVTLLLVGLLATVSGCNRGGSSSSEAEGGTVTQPEGPTPTSSAILAATLTPTGAANAAAEPTAIPVENGATDAGDSAQDEPAEAESETDSAEPAAPPPPTCDQEIALDLVGHPLYAQLNDLMGCPTDSSFSADVAINEFGPGPDYDRFMLWFSTDKRIYVLRPERTWQSYQDTWSEDQDEIQCNPTGIEETSPPLPRRGFGKLWCLESELQTVMGMVEREERLCQHTVIQQFEKGQVLGCFEDATIRYVHLLEDGSWDMRFVQ